MPFRKFILLLISGFLPILLSGQNDYRLFFEDGKKLIEEGRVQDSINLIVDGLKRLGWAKDERDIPQNTKDSILQYEKNTYLLLGDVSAKIKALVSSNESIAKENRQLYEAATLSVMAREEMEQGDSAVAIQHANMALNIAEDSILFKRTFGNAAYRFYKSKFSTERLIDLFFLENSTDYIVLPTGHEASLQREIGKPIFFSNDNSFIQSISVSPDGKHVLTGFKDHSIWLTNLEDNSVDTLKGHTDVINDAIFSPEGQFILSCSRDGQAILWDKTGNEIAILGGHEKNIRTASFSPDGNTILTLSADNSAKLWDLNGRAIGTLDHNGAWVFDANFSHNGKYALTHAADKTAKLWDTVTGKLLHDLGNDDMVFRTAFSYDSNKILICNAEGKVTVWDISGTSAESKTISEHAKRITASSFSPDGKFIITAHSGGTALIWNLDDIDKPTLLAGHTADITQTMFTNNGQRVLTTSKDKTAKYWDLEGNFLMNMDGFTGAVTMASFSDDDEWILLGSKVGEVVLAPTPEKAKEIFDKKETN